MTNRLSLGSSNEYAYSLRTWRKRTYIEDIRCTNVAILVLLCVNAVVKLLQGDDMEERWAVNNIKSDVQSKPITRYIHVRNNLRSKVTGVAITVHATMVMQTVLGLIRSQSAPHKPTLAIPPACQSVQALITAYV